VPACRRGRLIALLNRSILAIVKFQRLTRSFSIILGLFVLLAYPCHVFAQSKESAHLLTDSLRSTSVQIDKIFIIGFKKTKEHIIRRELSIIDGQYLSRAELEEAIIADKRKLVNTSLFLSVDINVIELSEDKVDIIIRVSERWYFFPIPIFNLADRNLQNGG